MSKESISENKSTLYMGCVINEMRMLPMSPNMFSNYQDASDFLLNTLPKCGCIPFYIWPKMNCKPNTLVLFQHHGNLIASAICLNRFEYDKTRKTSNGDEYWGVYSFAVNSIKLFKHPYDAIAYRKINQNFRSFGSSAQEIPMEYFVQIKALIESNGVISPQMPATLSEEISKDNFVVIKEGAKKSITVNAYERNSQAREKCISHYKKKNNGIIKCEICGFDFGKVYGEQFSDKIHVHHMLELSAIGEEYEVDPINDLLPVCPNCHLIAHSRTPAYTPDEIKGMLKKD